MKGADEVALQTRWWSETGLEDWVEGVKMRNLEEAVAMQRQ